MLRKTEAEQKDFNETKALDSAEKDLSLKMTQLLQRFDDEIPLHGDEKIVVDWRQELNSLLTQLKIGIMVSAIISLVVQSCKRADYSSGSNTARTRKYKPEPGPNLETNLKPKSCLKNLEI